MSTDHEVYEHDLTYKEILVCEWCGKEYEEPGESEDEYECSCGWEKPMPYWLQEHIIDTRPYIVDRNADGRVDWGPVVQKPMASRGPYWFNFVSKHINDWIKGK